MQHTVLVGKRLIPAAHIVLIEPVDPAALERLESQRNFQTRLTLLDRSSVLLEEGLLEFAKTHALKEVGDDGIAINPAVAFRIEAFEPSGDFQPTKPYRSRLLWRDPHGQTHNRLMVTEPEKLLALAVSSASGQGQRRGMASARSRNGGNPQPV